MAISQLNTVESLSATFNCRARIKMVRKSGECENVYNRTIIMLPDFPKVKEVLVAHARAQIEQVIGKS